MPQNDEYILDRWEGSTAVLEGPDGRLLDVPSSQLPPARPGDVLVRRGEVWQVDIQATQARKERIDALKKRLFGRP